MRTMITMAIAGVAAGGACAQEIPLACNWNGLVHPTEMGDEDRPLGYRSVGDRGMTTDDASSIGGGSYEIEIGPLTYAFEREADALDCIFLGIRNPFVPGQGFIGPWDDVIGDFDRFGVAPDWDPTAGTGILDSALSEFASTEPLGEDFVLGVLYNASNQGGDFEMTLGFTDGSSVSVFLNAADWFADFDPRPLPPDLGVATQDVIAGPLSGGDGFDSTYLDDAFFDSPLAVTEATVTTASLRDGLGFDVVGRQLKSVEFHDFIGGTSSGVGIYAASYANGAGCYADCDGSGALDFFDFLCFQNAFAGGDPYADCDGSGALDFFDFLCFQNEFAAGCP